MMDGEKIPFDNELVGIDEAGRGCCFSRIYVATVILPSDIEIPKDVIIKDSKKMTKKQREKSTEWIKKNAYAYKIGFEDEKVVDEINITQATMKAIHGCLSSLEEDGIQFKRIIMDGSYFLPYKRKDKSLVDFECIPKADSICLPVSCASILAKDARDSYVMDLVHRYPILDIRYDISNNMGYPSPKVGTS